MHFAVIVFPGSNCDHDAYHVFRHILDVPVDFVWHGETDLKKYDAILIPGGFSTRDGIYYKRSKCRQTSFWNM